MTSFELKCIRCGRTIPPPAHLAALATAAAASIRNRRLAVPDQAMERLASVIQALECMSALCDATGRAEEREP